MLNAKTCQPAKTQHIKSLSVFVLGSILSLAACQNDTAQTPETTQVEPKNLVAGADGVSIAYEVTGSGDKSLVFVHGWSCDRTYWRNQINLFSKNYRVISIDLAGHGESAGNRDDFSMSNFGRDVAAVIEHLDAKNVVLVGHSMGGVVVVEAADQLGDRVVGVIGIDTQKNVDAPLMPAELAGPFRAGLATDFAATADGFVRATMFSEHSDPELIETIVSDMVQADPRVGIAAGDGMMAVDYDARLAAIKDIPAGLINGDFEPMDEDAFRASHPTAPIVYIERSGHFPMLEKPDAFNAALREMVEGL